MGAWGINLYDDDMALDIRDTIQDELKFGIPLNKILDQLKIHYNIEKYDNNDEENFYKYRKALQKMESDFLTLSKSYKK